MSSLDAMLNLGLKATRRLQSAHKPLVRLMRRSARAREHRAFREDAADLDRQIGALATGTGPIVLGPWLGEVGYEVLYWIPFLRWFQDAHALPRERLIAVSRGGMDAAYSDLAGAYVDLFDLMSPKELARRNAERQSTVESGGQKQSGTSAFDEEILALVRQRAGVGRAAVCHPSLMFNLFRHVWYDNLPFDVLWRHTRYVAAERTAATLEALPLTATGFSLPSDFVTVKVYTGPALTASDSTRTLVRDLVARAASASPVIVLDTDVGVDEHRDFEFHDLPGVVSARSLMTPRTNLGVQRALIARSRCFLGTCGGLAWLAPFLGVPTVAMYDTDRLLAPHLFVARQAGARTRAAEFTPLDLRALGRLEFSRSIR